MVRPIVKKVLRRAAVFRRAAALYREARPYRSALRQAIDLVEHKLRINTNFADYYRFEFYRRDLSWEEKSMYLGPNGSRYWPFEGNSLKLDRVFVMKSLQKSLLMGSGLPTPKMLLKVGPEYPVNTLEKFRVALEDIDVPFLSKFDGGGGGADIFVFDRTADGLFHNGTPVDAEWIWNKYADRFDKGFIIEERIDNHPDLAALHPASLNTMRLVVVKTVDGKWHFLKPFLKIGMGGSNVDNMSAKGLFAGIDENGIVDTAYCRFDDREYDRHPDTGAQIRGFRVPHYQAALDLAIHASKTLGFMQTFGWDMAITPDGPMIIEANTGWHFKAVQQRLGPLLTPEIAAGLRRRSWYTPWDRTHMYPGYMRNYRGGIWQRFLVASRRRSYQRSIKEAAKKTGIRN